MDFVTEGSKIIVGTDSLASNHWLSILEELKTISNRYPQIDLNTLLEWSTLNGAKFLGIENRFGSFEKGKKPGIVLLENVNEHLQLNKNVSVKRIL